MILTYKYRIKDRSARKALTGHAFAINQVWNYCVAQQRHAESRYRAGSANAAWASRFDLQKLTAGASKELGIHAGSINEVCRQFSQSRAKAGRSPRFRASNGPRRALGWIPFRAPDRQIHDNRVTYLGKTYRFWLGGRPLPAIVKGGAFIEDSRGRWFVSFAVEVAQYESSISKSVGIDLGLKALATLSDGQRICAPQIFRQYEQKLATAQRSKNIRRARAIHAKIKNSRNDFLHKVTTQITRDYSLIAVGNVCSSWLAKTRMAKSVVDAGWATFRYQLRYKASRHGAVCLNVDERFTTQTCSCCGAIPDSSPKGMGALGIRAWECSECGENHDRDVNAAKNILAFALSAQRLDGGSCSRPVRGLGRIGTTLSNGNVAP